MDYSSLFAALPKGSLSDIIVDRITNALISGELKPGDRIPTEIEFSENLGVSRNAVREAIKVLVAFGVLEIKRSAGTFVVDHYTSSLLNPLIYGLILSDHSMSQLLDVKIAVSNSVMYLAIKDATDEEVAKLRELGEAFRDEMLDPSSDNDRRYHASLAFNEYLGDLTHNPMLDQLDGVVRKIASFTRHKAIEKSVEIGEPSLLPDNYLKEVELIESRDQRSIADFMDERMALWKRLLLEENEA